MSPTPPSPRRLGAATMLLLGLTAFTRLPAAEVLDLTGTWRQQIDPTGAGRSERWFARTLTGSIKLPGSLEESRIGDAITTDTKWTGDIVDKSWFTAPEYAPYRVPGNIKVPFWLQPDTHFTGAAWFQRDIEIPASWNGKHVSLTLERPHWKTTAWLDERELGSRDALSVAHHYDLGFDLSPGRHMLTVRVDNTLDPDIGANSHSVSDHTQGNWNGIVGRIELAATAPVWVDDLQIYPRATDRTAAVRGRLGRIEGQVWPRSVHLASPTAVSPTLDATVAADGSFSAEYVFGANATRWDEFTPALHKVTASLDNGESSETTFGFRSIAAEGRQLTINGRKLFLRGTLDCAVFPRTGHPPTDVATWRHEFGAIKAHGLNHVRFHSWCPPEAAFVAADEIGIYFQVECATWPNWSTTIGDGKPVDSWVDAETARILRAYGNHPSFTMFCAGNEPGGDHHAAWLAGWVARQKAADPRRLYTAGSGWPELPENDYHVTPGPRIQQWAEGLKSRINASPPETRTDYGDFIQSRRAPVVSHEIGQWCVFPNFAEMSKYTGYLKPRNFEIFQASLEAHGLGAQAHDFLISSGKLQVLCYKEEVESALRTPAMGGLQLLSLGDFPGQGTALVGVLDPFWEEKGYVTPAEFRRFCNSTVPLARFDKRVFTSDEHLVADVEVAHFGAAPLALVSASWNLVGDDGRVAARGSFAQRDIAVGAGQSLGHVDLDLAKLPAPARYKLVVALDGTEFANDWDVWVYPPAAQVTTAAPADVTITQRLDAAAQAKLEAGGTVWLMLSPSQVRPDAKKGPIAFGFSSIFWNSAWTNGQPPQTFGVLCDPKHPAFAAFPTDAWSNWQWWYPIKHAAPMILDELPRELRPIVQIVDDWVTNRKLGLVFEARVGSGKLLVTSIDLRGAVLDPVCRQLRGSLLAYAASPAFQPAVSVPADHVRSLSLP